MLSSGLGASVLAFFGEWGPVVECGGCSEWSGAGRLGEGRLGGLEECPGGSGRVVRDGSLGVIHLGH